MQQQSWMENGGRIVDLIIYGSIPEIHGMIEQVSPTK